MFNHFGMTWRNLAKLGPPRRILYFESFWEDLNKIGFTTLPFTTQLAPRRFGISWKHHGWRALPGRARRPPVFRVTVGQILFFLTFLRNLNSKSRQSHMSSTNTKTNQQMIFWIWAGGGPRAWVESSSRKSSPPQTKAMQTQVERWRALPGRARRPLLSHHLAALP